MARTNNDYTLFLGCMIPLRHPQIELAARKSLPAIGIGLQDAPGFTCCPEPWNFKGTDLDAWLAVAARNLAVGEKSGRDLLTLCNGCYSTLTEAAHILEGDGRLEEDMTKRLSSVGLSYSGKHKAKHVAAALAEVGVEKIREVAKNPLSDIKVAVHHGCHLLRPSEVMEFDDPFEPSVLEGLVEALGCEAVHYRGYTDCCGNATRDAQGSLSMASDKLTAMEEADADCVAVVCPACFEQFDLGQVEIKRKLKKDHGLPVLHYCQLLAIAEGEDPASLGLKKHRTNTGPLLSKLGSA